MRTVSFSNKGIYMQVRFSFLTRYSFMIIDSQICLRLNSIFLHDKRKSPIYSIFAISTTIRKFFKTSIQSSYARARDRAQVADFLYLQSIEQMQQIAESSASPRTRLELRNTRALTNRRSEKSTEGHREADTQQAGFVHHQRQKYRYQAIMMSVDL